MNKIVIAIAALAGVWIATPAEARDPLYYGYCNVTDHETLSVYSPIYYAEAERSDDYEKAAVAGYAKTHSFKGEPKGYCLNYQTKAEAEIEMAKMVAGDEQASNKVVRDARDPTKLPNPGGPSVWDAKTFLKETLTNGVSRVHPMRAVDSMVSDGLVVKSVSGGRCDSTIVYVGDWFGRPADYVLYVDWTKAVEVGPFFTDASRSHIKVLAATKEQRGAAPEPIAGFAIDPGSESMEARLTKALNVILDACRPKSSTGF